MRQLGAWLNRPEYLYQPGKLIHRALHRSSAKKGAQVVVLPWNFPLEIDASEVIGRIISHHGIFEMPVVETLFRLVDNTDTVLDAGANIGYMTAAAAAAGAKLVIAFEPNPVVFARLARNAERWKQNPAFHGNVEVLQKAIHSESGVSTLSIPRHSAHDGLSTLEMRDGEDGYDKVDVPTTTLDEVIHGSSGTVGVLKIDIEGHELQALSAARQSLSRSAIRDVLYEDFEGVSSETSKLLAGYGYSIFGLQASITGPILRQNPSPGKPRKGEHNFVATLNPARLKKRLSARGYRCLSRKSRTRSQN